MEHRPRSKPLHDLTKVLTPSVQKINWTRVSGRTYSKDPRDIKIIFEPPRNMRITTGWMNNVLYLCSQSYQRSFQHSSNGKSNVVSFRYKCWIRKKKQLVGIGSAASRKAVKVQSLKVTERSQYRWRRRGQMRKWIYMAQKTSVWQYWHSYVN